MEFSGTKCPNGEVQSVISSSQGTWFFYEEQWGSLRNLKLHIKPLKKSFGCAHIQILTLCTAIQQHHHGYCCISWWCFGHQRPPWSKRTFVPLLRIKSSSLSTAHRLVPSTSFTLLVTHCSRDGTWTEELNMSCSLFTGRAGKDPHLEILGCFNSRQYWPKWTNIRQSPTLMLMFTRGPH